MRDDVRKVTWGASIVALVGVMLLIDRYTAGMAAGYFSFLLPLPLILFAGKYGFKEALAPFVAILLVTALFAFPTTMFIVANAGATGLFYGWGVYKRLSNGKLLLITAVFTALSYFVTMFLFAAAFGYNIQEEIDYLVKVLGASQNSLPLNFRLEEFIRTLYPAALVFSAFIEALLIHFIAHLILKRFKYPVEQMKSIFEIHPPRWAGMVLSVAAFLPVLTTREDLRQYIYISHVASSLSLIMLFIYGIICVLWLIRRTGKRSAVLLFWLVLVITAPLSLFALVIMGAVDMSCGLRVWLDKRSTDGK